MKIPRLLFHVMGILAENLFPVSAVCAICSADAASCPLFSHIWCPVGH